MNLNLVLLPESRHQDPRSPPLLRSETRCLSHHRPTHTFRVHPANHEATTTSSLRSSYPFSNYPNPPPRGVLSDPLPTPVIDEQTLEPGGGVCRPSAYPGCLPLPLGKRPFPSLFPATTRRTLPTSPGRQTITPELCACSNWKRVSRTCNSCSLSSLFEDTRLIIHLC